MPLTISVPDSLRVSVEAATGGKQTVLYTATGQPCFMTVIPKFLKQDIDASLGTGTHEAFIVNSVEKTELFIGTYQGVSKNGELLSLPGVDPTASLDHDQFVTLARAGGTGWHLMSNAEWAAVALWCWKNGFQPRGNNYYGRDTANTWEQGRRQDGVVPGTASGTARILTGSGPASFRHDNSVSGISDLNGNVWEWTPGMRINAGEINVIANNDAALNATDMAVGSASWKAIDGSSGALVAPGSANTVKYATSGTTNYTLVRASGSSFEGMTNPGGTPVGATALALCTSLGLYPVAGSGLGADVFYVDATSERLPVRGGNWGDAADSGVFALGLLRARSSAYTSVGARPAFVA